MKKSLVSALTTALVVGAASTTFAAANPFSDVAADHWAYDAVAQLAQEGIVTGYADSSFQGDTTMTRYEMAQIVAKAMAKQDTMNATQKAMVDKLAAEFSDELANLGVRVANLESKVDNVRWTGLARYEYTRTNADDGETETENGMLARLEPVITINDNWTAYARIDATMDMNDSTKTSAVDAKRVWVQGEYDSFTVKFGRFPSFANAVHGLVTDTEVSGAEVSFGNVVKTQLTAGRWVALGDEDTATPSPSTYLAADVQYAANKLELGAGYYQWGDIKGTGIVADDGAKIGAWGVGAGYQFDDNWKATADYVNFRNVLNSSDKRSYNFQVNYKGADQETPGTYGVFVAYRKLNADTANFGVTYDTAAGAQKGWVIGGDVALTKNVVGFVEYFRGKDYTRNSNDKKSVFYGKVEFLF